MLRLKYVEDTGTSRFRRIAEAKDAERSGRLLALEPSIAARYEEYSARTEYLERVNACTLDALSRGDCEHCYDVETVPLRELKESILSAQGDYAKGICQYCGISECKTFDHYLPKGAFPEYSVYSKNLVPACYACNNLKRAVWLVGGRRAFYNHYFDSALEHTFLVADAVVADDLSCGMVEYRLTRPVELPEGLYQVLCEHYKRLDLLARYKAVAIPEWSELIDVVKKRVGGDIRRIVDDLVITAMSLSEHRGVNHWKPVLIRAAIGSLQERTQR